MKEELLEFFSGMKLPDKLLKLCDFQNEIGKGDFYSEGFELSIDKEKIGLKTYSDDDNFLNYIYEFANADSTGSTYGFWFSSFNQNLNEAPICVFGSEGEYHIVANNFDELRQILTFDSEPIIDWDEVYFYKDPDDYEPSPKSKELIDWVKLSFDIESTNEPDSIVKSAQENHQENFKEWVGKFYAD